MTGVPPSGSGSRAAHEAAKASSPEASIPNAAFTPGPWEIQRVPEYHIAGDTITADLDAPPNTWAIKRTFKRPTGARVTQYISQAFVLPDRDGEANARLIAASPDLYEALSALINYDEETGGAVPKIYMIRAGKAALAKARGDQS